MDLICCRGGEMRYVPIVLGRGWRYGLRSDYRALPDTPVAFLDVNFAAGRRVWERHLARALELRPELTMVPDWDLRYTISDLMALHTLLTAAGLRTMWTPKQHGVVRLIPPEAVIGVSVPTRHAGFLPDPAEVAGRELHLLGGDPAAIRYLMAVYGQVAAIRSVDTAAFIRKAGFGQFWESGQWAVPPRPTSTEALVALSATNIRVYLCADAASVLTWRRPVRRCVALLDPGARVSQLNLI